MKNYRGYTIDGVWFHSEKEIDEFIKNKDVESYKNMIRYFEKHSTMEANIRCMEMADMLHKKHGFTYAEIEEFELAAIA